MSEEISDFQQKFLGRVIRFAFLGAYRIFLGTIFFQKREQFHFQLANLHTLYEGMTFLTYRVTRESNEKNTKLQVYVNT